METYIEKQDEKLWVCELCGKTTAGYDGDYLVSHDLHLSCHLTKEIKREQSVKNNKERERNY